MDPHLVVVVLDRARLDPTLRRALESAIARGLQPAHGEPRPETHRGVEARRRERERSRRDDLVEALEACEGNLAEVGRRLGLSRGAVIHRAKKYGLL
jgi:transcriptional regulator of acetoin/glycerol metabolism